MTPESVVFVQDVQKSYKLETQNVPILFDIDLEVRKGDFVSIMGPSGCGKSTLMNLIGCLDRPDSGVIKIDGTDVSKLSDSAAAHVRNKKIGFVFQTFNLLPKLSSRDNVELPLIYSGVSGETRKQLSDKALASVGITHRAEHRPNQLSGGERQRVAIARAIINDPALILADEPTGNLDSRSGAEVMKIFKDLNSRGVTILMVTHDKDIASFGNRIVRLFDGRVVEDRAQ